ncbi:adenine-specific methyltransferase EcoRI family protein [Leptotrichia sp. HSP-536]|uniref:Adenine-specific methyltransferase EcoRI family protein n=1 Tax=Leptotrichia alba TaxID=3239304 RepID=A0AB39V3T6_9FUSO
MRKNENDFLRKAKKNKNDEFYTRLGDIERELQYYEKHFKNKIVFCNCDDPVTSNFFNKRARSLRLLKAGDELLFFVKKIEKRIYL